jgi:hypothetical protein
MDRKNGSAKIVRALMTVTGKGTFLFNDKIRGGRSIKVRGWKQEHYEVAVAALKKQGIDAALVTTPVINKMWNQGGSLRIHTKEAA